MIQVVRQHGGGAGDYKRRGYGQNNEYNQSGRSDYGNHKKVRFAR